MVWRFQTPIEKFSNDFPDYVKNFSQSAPVQKAETTVKDISKQIFAPLPLKKISSVGSSTPQPSPSSAALTISGVIRWTNIQRNQNGGLAALKENVLLDKAAQLKMQDMFKQQYFEHVNPQGKGPAELAAQVGYSYIAIGENLALGAFSSDPALVNDWMNSPGHRANILNSRFMEIGVAVGLGNYQGHTEWLAVQEFGKPSSSCPGVDSNLKAQINALQADINTLQPQMAQLKAQIDSAHPQTQAEYDAYNQNVADYNNLVKIYNNKVDSLKLATDQYNLEVADYNACSAA